MTDRPGRGVGRLRRYALDLLGSLLCDPALCETCQMLCGQAKVQLLSKRMLTCASHGASTDGEFNLALPANVRTNACPVVALRAAFVSVHAQSMTGCRTNRPTHPRSATSRERCFTVWTDE